jgi:hypothetical protein
MGGAGDGGCVGVGVLGGDAGEEEAAFGGEEVVYIVYGARSLRLILGRRGRGWGYESGVERDRWFEEAVEWGGGESWGEVCGE